MTKGNAEYFIMSTSVEEIMCLLQTLQPPDKEELINC